MFKIAAVSVAVCALVSTAVLAPPASARMIDRTGQMCAESVITAKLQKEDGKQEVDVEVYSKSPGQKWRLEIRGGTGKVLHRINRTTGRDAAFDVWRYVPFNADQIDVRLTGPSGQECLLELTAQ
jgi:hypothetical protein